MTVVKLTKEQADEIRGFEFAPRSLIYPIQDKNGNWIISLEEVEQCSLEWVKNLPQINYEPIVHDFL
jgi:hypothetical protein